MFKTEGIKLEDNFIIEQVTSGNTNAYRFLVLRYQKPLFKYLKSFGFNSSIVEEIAQETFIKAFKNLKGFDKEQSRFSTWLFVVAKNTALNELSRHAYKKEMTFKEFPEIESNSSPISAYEEGELKANLGELMKELPIQFRNALTLFHLNEMSLDEISQIENCSLGTVKSRIHRAKEMLKNLIKQKYGTEGL